MKPFSIAAPLRFLLPLWGLGAALSLCAVPAGAVDENTPGWFVFVIPSLDESKTPVDLSWLSPEPAGARGRIRIVEGHFADADGKRIRFLGTNATFDAALPPKDVAPLVAAHMRKLGLNLVRFHHLDTAPSPRGILKGDRKTFDPEMLDRLDFFIHQLEQHGIYVNMNLHVGRNYPGLPPDLPRAFRMGKIVDRFHRPFIEMQKDYARELLTRKNPYTGKSLAEDPGVLTVEMNNENTLLNASWGELDALPDPWRASLLEQWRAWLAEHYASDKAMRAAWSPGLAEPGEELLENGGFADGLKNWSIQQIPPLEAEAEIQPGAGPDGTPALAARIAAPGAVNWAFQIHQVGLTLEDGQPYTLAFDTRAPEKRTFSVNARLDREPWTNIGLDQRATAGPEWRRFEFSFVAKNTQPGHCRVSLGLGAEPCEIWIANVSLRPGSGSALERLQAATRGEAGIPVAGASSQERGDFRRFLFETERKHVLEIRDFLRKELNVQASIVDTQASYGGLAGVYREIAVGDQIDMHAYWQHPKFPGKPWDPKNWRIDNTPLAGSKNGGTLTHLARHRLQGRPFSVSEYNHPAPSYYSAEMFPMYSSFASFQDWDAIYQFTYRNSGAQWDNQMIASYFNLDGNPAQLAFVPFAAIAFRGGAFAADREAAILGIPAEGDDLLAQREKQGVDEAWSEAGAADLLPTLFPVALRLEKGLAAPRLSAPDSAGAQEAKPSASKISWDPESAVYRAESPTAVALTGAIADPAKPQRLGPFQLAIEETSNGFATFAACSLDGKPLAESGKVLVALANRVENTNMGWNEDFTSVGNQWGQPPTRAEAVRARIEFCGKASQAVSGLDGTGAMKQKIKADRKGDSISFQTGPETETLWFLLSDRAAQQGGAEND